MDKKKLISILSIAVSVAAAGLSVASGFINDSKMKEEIAEQVSKAVAELK